MIDIKSIDLKAMIWDRLPDNVKELLDSERFKVNAQLGAIALVAALYLTFAIVPKSSTLSNISRKVQELSNKIDLTNNHIRRLGEMQEKLKTLNSELESYSQGLPDQKEITEFLQELSTIAKSSMVKILSITPSEDIVPEKGEDEDKSKKHYKELPVVITAKSGYHQLGQFVSILEQGKRFITIQDLRIREDKRTPRSHDIRMVLKTYVSVGN